jgi:uncharacterized protein
MKRMIAWIAGLLTLIVSFTSGAQSAHTKSTASKNEKINPKDRSLLWRISGKQLTKPSFLFGTIHMICASDYLWTQKMQESLTKSEKVCFEMDLDDPTVMMEVATGLLDKSGKKLEDYFTPEQYTLLSRYIKDSLGMDIAMFAQMKPVALQSIIGTAGLNCPNPVSYEDSIMKTAVKDKKEILGLEEPQEQLDVLESMPVDSVIKELMDQIANVKENDSQYTQLIKAYKEQDLPGLFTLITSSKDLGDEMGLFLDDRNKKWISRISDKMKHASVFFAVGAGHLYGRNGVINLLRKQGYTVEPLK